MIFRTCEWLIDALRWISVCAFCDASLVCDGSLVINRVIIILAALVAITKPGAREAIL